MPEPVTTIGIGAIAAYLGKDGLQKLLGPTAEYLGDGLKNFTQKRVDNVGKIFSNASAKLGGKIEENASIPPKLLKQVMDEGSFADDKVEIDYLGGVVASSRSDVERDNRGVRIAKKIDSLSNYQLRTHYLIYRSIADLFRWDGIIPDMSGRPKLKLFIPLNQYSISMDFSYKESTNLSQILNHTLFGLHNDNLIEGHFQYGGPDSMKSAFPDASEPGIICQPSAPGIELFLWAFGMGGENLHHIFDENFDPRIDGVPAGIVGARKASKTG